MSYEWVDLETGEVVEEGVEGAVAVPLADEATLADAQALGDWFTRELVSLDAREQALKMQFDRAKKSLAAERRALERLLPQVEEAARELLTGKKKSVDFAYGRASFRKSRKLIVDDEEAALEWAEAFAPEAVKVKRSLLKSMLPEDCPHAHKDEGETFSVKGAK